MAITSNLNYLAPIVLWEETKPYEITGNVSAEIPRTNFQFQPYAVAIKDTRALKDGISLSTHGFEWVSHETVEDFKTDESVNRYIKELEGFVKDYFNAEKVLTFQYQVQLSHNPVKVSQN